MSAMGRMPNGSFRHHDISHTDSYHTKTTLARGRWDGAAIRSTENGVVRLRTYIPRSIQQCPVHTRSANKGEGLLTANPITIRVCAIDFLSAARKSGAKRARLEDLICTGRLGRWNGAGWGWLWSTFCDRACKLTISNITKHSLRCHCVSVRYQS